LKDSKKKDSKSETVNSSPRKLKEMHSVNSGKSTDTIIIPSSKTSKRAMRKRSRKKRKTKPKTKKSKPSISVGNDTTISTKSRAFSKTFFVETPTTSHRKKVRK
jgi:hypothetical protein